LVAREVVMPNEKSEFVALGMENTGGFLPGYAMVKRTNFLDRVSVNFLETEMDIEHNFFRPWLIAIEHKGLIEQGVSLKGDMEVRQYTNGGQLMKGFKFTKVFPTAIESFRLDYGNTDFKEKSINFACQNYEQL